MRGALLGLAALCLLACGGGAPKAAPASPPAADARAAAAAAERADDTIRAAYATANPAPLQGVLAGRALNVARRQVAMLAKTGARRDEQLQSRRVVHETVSGARAEVVLLVSARQRVIRPGAAAAPSFSVVLRQWRATLSRQGSGWVVVDDGDIPPAQWWPS